MFFYSWCKVERTYDEKDIPINLQATGYKFKIKAEKVSDNEYVFMFNKAVVI